MLLTTTNGAKDLEFRASSDKEGCVLVVFFSRHLSARERVLMAGVEAIEHFKPFVCGIEFLAVTDHQPLNAMVEMDNPKNKLARWLDRLRNYEWH
jgi:hypothetical protein